MSAGTPEGADVLARIERLRRDIRRHSRLYYVENAPEIPDRDFDALMEELLRLEREHPEFADPDSPTQKVGGEPIDEFRAVDHLTPMRSIDNTYNEEEVREFDKRVGKLLGEGAAWSYVVEPKIDGVAINLIYRDGVLAQAITRGDGKRGDDVTENAKTVGGVPLGLRFDDDRPDPALQGSVLEIRGEVYMPFSGFRQVNADRAATGKPLFANPRNATAGSLKLLDPKATKTRRLQVFLYEIGQAEGAEVPGSHWARLRWLKEHGCPTSPAVRECAAVDDVLKLCAEWQDAPHDYAVDGLVVKVDSIEQRGQLGHTAKAPRWMMAYKFAAEQRETIVQAIKVQVGKSGQLTPVAKLEPVQIAGTTVSSASLHNFDEVARKDIRVGDHVLVQKAGEIIPQVVEVLAEKRTGGETAVARPTSCPACGGPVREEASDKKKCMDDACEGAARLKSRARVPLEGESCDVCGGDVKWPKPKTQPRKNYKACVNAGCEAFGIEKPLPFLPAERDRCSDCGGPVSVVVLYYCDNPGCSAQLAERIIHFASRGAMDIENLGDKVVRELLDAGFISGVPDLYRLAERRDELEALKGKGRTSVENLLDGLHTSILHPTR